MGIIKRQAIHSSIYVYLGVGLGFLNTALLMPNLITSEQIGLLSLLNSVTSIFSSIFALGIPLITIQLFPKFRDKEAHNHGFFSFTLLVTIAGCILGSITYLLVEDLLLSDKNAARDYAPFYYAFFILFCLRLAGKNFDALTRMLYNTVIGAFTENFLLKFIVSAALVVYWIYEGYEFIYLFGLYALALAAPGIVSIFYLIFLGEWKFKLGIFLKSRIAPIKEFLSYGFFGLLANIGGIIVLEIDRVMISNMLSLSANGIYTTTFFFGIFLTLPSRGIRRVASVVIADAWKTNDTNTIREINQKSALNQLLFGLYLFLGVWLNVDYVFQILPVEYSAGKYVILVIGLGKLLEMSMGVNAETISSSQFYRYNTYFNGVLIVLTIAFNYYFIPIWGITGAAIATSASLVIVNLLRYLLLLYHYQIQTLQFKMLVVLIIGLGVYAIISLLIPKVSNPVLGILMTGSALTALYWVPSYIFSVSMDVNDTIHKFIRIIKERIK